MDKCIDVALEKGEHQDSQHYGIWSAYKLYIACNESYEHIDKKLNKIRKRIK